MRKPFGASGALAITAEKITTALGIIAVVATLAWAAGGLREHQVDVRATALQSNVYQIDNAPVSATDAVFADTTLSGFSATGTFAAPPATITQPTWPRRLEVRVEDASGSNLRGCLQFAGADARGEARIENVCFASGDFSGSPRRATDTTQFAYARLWKIDGDPTFDSLDTATDKLYVGTTNSFGLPHRLTACSDIYKVQWRTDAATWGDITNYWANPTIGNACDIGSTGVAEKGKRTLVHLNVDPDGSNDWRFYYNTRNR